MNRSLSQLRRKRSRSSQKEKSLHRGLLVGHRADRPVDRRVYLLFHHHLHVRSLTRSLGSTGRLLYSA